MQKPGNELWRMLRPPSGQDENNALTAFTDGSINCMLLEQLSLMPDIRTELVLFLRRAIEEDRYYVPEELVAECIIYRCLADSGLTT